MSIIKIYEMSTVEEVKRTSSRVTERQKEEKYTDYSSENIMLVRTTNIFPTNRKLTTLADTSFIAKTNTNFIHSSLFYGLDVETLQQLETYAPCYRSTIHFTENGLVSSHMYGNFDNQSFIILEPLVEQLGKSNFRNFAGQDTFVEGNVTLSEKAIIIIKTDDYPMIKENYPEIENYNVILYNGIPTSEKQKYIEENQDNMPEFDVNDQRAIVETVLMDLGYTPELIGSHYIINSPTSDKIRKVNCQLAEQYGVLAEAKHHYTKEYGEDYNKNLIITEIFDKQLLNFIIKRHELENEFFLNREKISNNNADKLIQILGIEAIIHDIECFNDTIEKMHATGQIPTCEELLKSNTLDIYNQFINLEHIKNSK